MESCHLQQNGWNWIHKGKKPEKERKAVLPYMWELKKKTVKKKEKERKKRKVH